MSNNIWGYQGLQTPLENLTRGDYNVADYTNLRREFGARIQALENAGGFIPTNMTIQGFCKVTPGSGGGGYLTTDSYATIGGYLTVAGQVTCSAGLTVAGSITAGTFTPTTVNTTSAVVSGNLNAGSITSGPTTVTGNLTCNSGIISGNGSGLTGVSGTDNTKLPTAGGIMTGSLTVNAPGIISGNGSGLTGVVATDNTKLPLAGGTMTGQINAQNIVFSESYSAFNYKNNRLSNIANLINGQTFSITQQNSSVHDYVCLLYNYSCTINLVNLSSTNGNFYQDRQRCVTITKRANTGAGFAVTILPPSGAFFNSPAGINASSYTIPLLTFSVTFMIIADGGGQYVDLISSV
jgi:hypothetical protein